MFININRGWSNFGPENVVFGTANQCAESKLIEESQKNRHARWRYVN
ncbi:MAG: hypothetical protein ACI92A_002225, partial [Candidatus Paceibacteria bacterium]